MGYEISFAPTQEAVDAKLKVYKANNDDLNKKLNDYKLELSLFCMRDYIDADPKNTILQIKIYLKLIKSIIEDIQKEIKKKGYEESEDKSFYFCGWEYANDNNANSYIDDSFINYYIKKFAILTTLVKTDNYFAENTNFNNKLEEIEETLDNFESDCFTAASWKIINDFKEFKKNDDTLEND